MLALLAMSIKFIKIGIRIKKLKPKKQFRGQKKYIYVGYIQINMLLFLQPECNAS